MGESGAPSSFFRRVAINTRSEAILFSQPTPHTFCVMNLWVRTFPTFCARRHSSRYSIQIIDEKYIICALHMPSRLYAEERDREIFCNQIVKTIEQTEKSKKIESSILFGDFNSDPYDSSCLSANCFHGLPNSADANRIRRTVQVQSFLMFYNPMWNRFGDFLSPPGTYYHSNGKAMTPFWHMFDQVMIRPCLINALTPSKLQIIVRAGSISLLDSKGHPNSEQFSDHLPITFEIEEKNDEH